MRTAECHKSLTNYKVPPSLWLPLTRQQATLLSRCPDKCSQLSRLSAADPIRGNQKYRIQRPLLSSPLRNSVYLTRVRVTCEGNVNVHVSLPGPLTTMTLSIRVLHVDKDTVVQLLTFNLT